MKKSFFVLLIGIALTIPSFAQIADNIIARYTGQGKIVLVSGDTIKGNLDFLVNTPGRVTITPDGQEKGVKYKCDEAKEFTVADKQYFAIKMKGGEITIGNTTSYAQIITPVDAKIKVFQFEAQPEIKITKSYYISIPGDETAYALSDLKFTPLKKMAGYVKDCQSLVDQITNKEKGFWFPLTAPDEARKEVFLNISRAYYECK